MFGRCVIGVKKTVHIYKFNRPRLLFHPKRSQKAAEMYEYEDEIGTLCMNMKRKLENFSHMIFKTDVNLCVFFCDVVDAFLKEKAYITNAYTDSCDDGY